MIDGQTKGRKYENHVASVIADWIDPLPSGSWADEKMHRWPVQRRPADVQHIPTDWVGQRDLIHKPSLHFPWTVEIKKVEGWEMEHLFNGCGPLWKWWEQAYAQSAQYTLPPLLIFSRNRQDDYVMLEEGETEWFQQLRKMTHVRIKREKPLLVMLLSELCQMRPLLDHHPLKETRSICLQEKSKNTLPNTSESKSLRQKLRGRESYHSSSAH